MDKIDVILKQIQKTNPEMTKEKLILSLSQPAYMTNALLIFATLSHN